VVVVYDNIKASRGSGPGATLCISTSELYRLIFYFDSTHIYDSLALDFWVGPTINWSTRPIIIRSVDSPTYGNRWHTTGNLAPWDGNGIFGVNANMHIPLTL
jgi:hypothetical protein